MKKVKLVIALLFGITFFISCDSRTQQDLEGVVTNPTYVKNIKPIMDAKCVSCHSQSGQGNFPDLDTYSAVKSAQDGTNSDKLLCSILSGSCTSDRMPKSDAPLSNGSITTITNWINNNYPEQ
jgi:cytochrome c553